MLHAPMEQANCVDFVTVNENAAEPPVEAVEKDVNINSHEALSFEATQINKSFCEQILEQSGETIEFSNENPFIGDTPIDEIASKAYRYRKWDLDGTDLFMRTSISSACHSKTNLELIDTTPIPETSTCNDYSLNEFDQKAIGSGGNLNWRKKLESQKGSVFVAEMKNNSYKLSKWGTQSFLAGVDFLRLGYCSRQNVKDRKRHHILSSSLYKPDEFLEQLGVDVGNGWGIIKVVIDIVNAFPDGKFVLVKDPERPCLLIYEVGTSGEVLTV
jgi:translation initiation factor 3 subunit D